MKTIELTDAQFQFLGSVLGHYFCGQHPELEPLYGKFRQLNNDESFGELSINPMLSRNFCIYLNPPMVGRVVSFNVPHGPNEKACLVEIEKIIKQFNGELISD